MYICMYVYAHIHIYIYIYKYTCKCVYKPIHMIGVGEEGARVVAVERGRLFYKVCRHVYVVLDKSSGSGVRYTYMYHI